TDEFALEFGLDSNIFSEFKGTISSISLDENPCDDLIIDIPGSSGGAYDGGDNTGADPSNGDSSGIGGGSGGGCISFYLSCECGRTYQNLESYTSSMCGDGSYPGYDLTIVVVQFACRMALDPCDEEGGLVAVLPVINIEDAIEKRINDTDLDNCTKEILNKLKDLRQNDIANIMRRFDAPYSIFNVNLSQVPNLVYPDTQQPAYGLFVPTQEPLNYDIQLNANYFKDDGATNLGKASTILHEFMHALIASVIQNPNTPNNTDSTDFPEVWNAYVNLKRGSATPEDHTFMGNHYVNIIGAALQEYDTGVPVPDGQTPQQLYTDLAWSGLYKPWTPNLSFSGVLSQSDKIRIDSRKQAEMTNQEANGVMPTNNPSCLD
ncbi:MAG: hypothetical protein KDC90_18475, partial [Ignavibacteriae bacterium]|nr:hypothetical protein [Ignavibacteriota bacterium]